MVHVSPKRNQAHKAALAHGEQHESEPHRAGVGRAQCPRASGDRVEVRLEARPQVRGNVRQNVRERRDERVSKREGTTHRL